MAFKTIHTNAGLSRLAAAEASGSPINLVAMAVGDGNGNAVTPLPTQTGLVREMYRHAPNRVYQDPVDPKLFTAELIVPASVSGFTMREVACFDADGTMLVVGNLPDTYKPNVADGAYSDAVVRVQFYVSNASVVTLIIDPSVSVASQQWVINNITPAVLFPGGTTHQVLRKKSNADGDTEWADPTDFDTIVSAIEETQTLAAGQTVVNWATVTNEGLAIYIEGVRLRLDQFTKHPTIATRITLAASYPGGTKIVGTQNEPASTLTDPLAKSQNLNDLQNKATARANLDVLSKAESNAAGQPGMVAYFAGPASPTGWLKANGAAVSRSAYAALFAVIGVTYGSGNGFDTFNLPDLRGEFIRGLDEGRGLDPGRALGSAQADQFRSHTHATGVISETGVYAESGDASGSTTASSLTTLPTGGTETRPVNVALVPCIKY
jgi:phage-related tail fiber protein